MISLEESNMIALNSLEGMRNSLYEEESPFATCLCLKIDYLKTLLQSKIGYSRVNGIFLAYLRYLLDTQKDKYIFFNSDSEKYAVPTFGSHYRRNLKKIDPEQLSLIEQLLLEALWCGYYSYILTFEGKTSIVTFKSLDVHDYLLSQYWQGVIYKWPPFFTKNHESNIRFCTNGVYQKLIFWMLENKIKIGGYFKKVSPAEFLRSVAATAGLLRAIEAQHLVISSDNAKDPLQCRWEWRSPGVERDIVTPDEIVEHWFSTTGKFADENSIDDLRQIHSILAARYVYMDMFLSSKMKDTPEKREFYDDLAVKILLDVLVNEGHLEECWGMDGVDWMNSTAPKIIELMRKSSLANTEMPTCYHLAMACVELLSGSNVDESLVRQVATLIGSDLELFDVINSFMVSDYL